MAQGSVAIAAPWRSTAPSKPRNTSGLLLLRMWRRSVTDIDDRWLDDVLALLQQVAEHFKNTDAPLGLEARRLFYEAGR